MRHQLSIVIPVFNEEQSIEFLFEALNKLRPQLPKKIEVIIVNDGSTDNTVNQVSSTQLLYDKKLISFTRNFGHQSALLAGLQAADGELVVSMDADLQHPPALLPKMIQLAKQGYDVVLTQKISARGVSHAKLITSQLFYQLINLFSDVQIVDSASDFRLLSRSALDALLQLPEKRIFLRGLVNWIGFEKIIVPFDVPPRIAGHSKYSLKKMLVLAVSGIVSFSTVPLYVAGILGLLLAVLSSIYGVYVLTQYFLGATVSGWTSIQLMLLVIGSGIFIFLGILGVYVAAIFDEVKNRPSYIIKKVSNASK